MWKTVHIFRDKNIGREKRRKEKKEADQKEEKKEGNQKKTEGNQKGLIERGIHKITKRARTEEVLYYESRVSHGACQG
jgi:hypothetical protein